MSRKRKKSKAVPVVLIITILVAALAAGCFLIKPMVTDPLRKASAEELAKQQNEINQKNQEIMAEYNATILDLQNQQSAVEPSNPSWPEHKSEGWDIIDLTNYPLENPTAVSATRQDLMYNGMLLLNEWHSRPEDFNDSGVTSVGKHLGGNSKIQVKDYNVSLFPVASDALMEALTAAKEEGLEHFIVEEGYRSWETQNQYFQKRMEKLSTKYSGDALIAFLRTQR